MFFNFQSVRNKLAYFLSRNRLVYLLLVVSLLVSRFVGLGWGNGFFFHPDENNMAWAIGRFSWPDMNPHFFAYNQFPLYLVYFSCQVVRFILGFGLPSRIPFFWVVYGLRFWSAVFSVLTVYFGYLLAKELFSKKIWAKIFALLMIFSPGLIQVAHFGTTESILTFTALALTYFSIKLLKTNNWFYICLISLISAIGLATKINALLFCLALFMVLLRGKKKIKKVFLWLGLTLLLSIMFSPYSVLNFEDFINTINYESMVAWGTKPVFYTRQFFDTIPFVFQLKKVFPWVLGPPMFFLLVPSLFLFLKRLWQKRIKFSPVFFIILVSFLPWFIFNSFLFVKWVRFSVPILPFLILGITWFLKELKIKKFLFPVLLVLIFPGVLFTKLYFLPDIRVKASEWINENLIKESHILSEAGNVVNLPLFNGKEFQITNFGFYELEENENLEGELEDLINQSDYILLPSRRIFANHLRLGKKFPKTAGFYQKLFSGDLGFTLIKEFKPFTPFEELFLGSDLLSEETWTVFDHPTIRLFKRI